MLKDIFDIDSYQSFFEKGGWFNIGENLQSVLNALINILFGLIKYIVQAMDYVIDKLFNLNLLENVLPSLFSTASSIYTKLFSVLGILLFTFVIVLVVRDFFDKGITKALIRLSVFLLIYFGSLVFFQDGAEKIQQVNTISQNVQGQLVDLTSGSIGNVSSSTSDIFLGDTSSLDGTSKIRNLIFDEFVMKPYALINFGKTDISKEQYEAYLVKQGDEFDDAKSDEIADKIKEDADENSYLTSDRMTEKIAVLLNTVIMLFVIGAAVLLIGIANIIVQLLIYALIFLFPSLLFLALIPNMHNLLKNGFMLLGMLFASKIGLGFGFGLLFSIINLLDSFFVVTNIVTMIVGLFVKVLLGFFIWKNKGMILRSLTKGQAELRGFSFNPTKSFQERSKQKENEISRRNQFEEQRYKTDTAENEYLRSEIELEQVYQVNELSDNVLQATGREPTFQNEATVDSIDQETLHENEDFSESQKQSTNTENEYVEKTGAANSFYSVDDTSTLNASNIEDSSEEASSSDASLLEIQQEQSKENLDKIIEKQEKITMPNPISKDEAAELEKELASLRNQSNVIEIEGEADEEV